MAPFYGQKGVRGLISINEIPKSVSENSKHQRVFKGLLNDERLICPVACHGEPLVERSKGGVAPLVAGRRGTPRPSFVSSADLYVPTRIHSKMLLGKKAGSEATVGRKPIARVFFQECPTGSSRCPLEGGNAKQVPPPNWLRGVGEVNISH